MSHARRRASNEEHNTRRLRGREARDIPSAAKPGGSERKVVLAGVQVSRGVSEGVVGRSALGGLRNKVALGMNVVSSEE